MTPCDSAPVRAEVWQQSPWMAMGTERTPIPLVRVEIGERTDTGLRNLRSLCLFICLFIFSSTYIT